MYKSVSSFTCREKQLELVRACVISTLYHFLSQVEARVSLFDGCSLTRSESGYNSAEQSPGVPEPCASPRLIEIFLCRGAIIR